MIGCSSPQVEETKAEVIIPTSKKAVAFYESGKTKANNIFQNISGVNTLVGFEELHENGAVKIKGAFNSSGKRVGLWESFYEDGVDWSIGFYSNGVEVGEKKTWYPDGKLRYEGQMKNGKPFGDWIFWSEEGEKSIRSYK